MADVGGGVAQEFFSVWGASTSGGIDDLLDLDGLVVAELAAMHGPRCRTLAGGDFSAEEIAAMELQYGARLIRRS